MSINDFLKQTCTIESVSRTNTKGTQGATKTPLYTNIPCFLYQEKRKQQVDSIATEDQVGNIILLIEKDKIGVEKNDRVTITDPDLGSLGEYSIAVVEKHRSFTGIGGITLYLKKLENGIN